MVSGIFWMVSWGSGQIQIVPRFSKYAKNEEIFTWKQNFLSSESTYHF